MSITPITSDFGAVSAIDPGRAAAGTSGDPSAVAGSFERLLDAAQTSNDGANSAVGKMIDGSGDVHDAMIALQRAELTLQLTVQVRNKLVQAYQDILRMPV